MIIQVDWRVDEDSSIFKRWWRFKYVDALMKIQVRWNVDEYSSTLTRW
jgi:hypothetical protein